MPFRILYGISDGLFLLLYYGTGYRRGVVETNLRNAFPDKTDPEIRRIGKQYYRYLCDLFLETFKTLTIRRKAMLARCSFQQGAVDLFNHLSDTHQSIVLVMGHFGNWEWAGNSFSMMCRQQLYVIYHPLRNRYFDGLMYRMRTRFNTKLIAMQDTYKEMLKHKKQGSVTATAFIADQTPQPQHAYWVTFLHQDTPVFQGTERIARKLGYPVVYASVKRVKRGYYEIAAEVLVKDPASCAEGEISFLHTKRLEQDILLQPEIWLWSHRRWKHKRPAGA